MNNRLDQMRRLFAEWRKNPPPEIAQLLAIMEPGIERVVDALDRCGEQERRDLITAFGMEMLEQYGPQVGLFFVDQISWRLGVREGERGLQRAAQKWLH